MSIQENFEKFLRKYPHPHVPFYNRPHVSRRRFFEIIGAGVTGSYLVQRSRHWPLIQLSRRHYRSLPRTRPRM